MKITQKCSLILVILFLSVWVTGSAFAETKSADSGDGLINTITEKVTDKVSDKVTSELKKDATEAVAQAEKKGQQVIKSNLNNKSVSDAVKNPVFLILAALFVIMVVRKLVKAAISLALLAVVYLVVMHFIR